MSIHPFILSDCEPPCLEAKLYALLVANPTKSHHFIAQTEQRQHAFNNHVSPHNKNVYSWARSLWKPPYQGEAVSVNIEGNLTAQNLYTLSFVDGSSNKQYNLENWFNRHESGYEDACNALQVLAAGEQIAPQAVLRAFRLKLLSMLRNPYNHHHEMVQHIFAAFIPFLPRTSTAFRRLIAQRPTDRIQNILSSFQFTFNEYTDWLASLYGILGEGMYRPSLFERLLQALLCDAHHIYFVLYRYDIEPYYCFFPDTGFCVRNNENEWRLDFSLAANMILSCYIQKTHWQQLWQHLFNPPPFAKLTLRIDENDHHQRLLFNHLCVQQAKQAVFGKSNQLAAFF